MGALQCASQAPSASENLDRRVLAENICMPWTSDNLMSDEDWQCRVVQDVAGRATEDELPNGYKPL